jgi:hypothetical protein
MSNSLTYDQYVREHPSFKAGFTRGRDVGLMIALNIITEEWARQVDYAIIASLDARQPGSAIHEHTAGRLDAVARIVAATFRQGAQR